MAKEMKYVAQDGTVFSTAYFIPIRVTLDPVNKTAQVIFAGYESAESRLKNPKADIAAKSYLVSPDVYDGYFGIAAIQGDGKNAIKAAYALATDIKEEDGKSFFDGAADV